MATTDLSPKRGAAGRAVLQEKAKARRTGATPLKDCSASEVLDLDTRRAPQRHFELCILGWPAYRTASGAASKGGSSGDYSSEKLKSDDCNETAEKLRTEALKDFGLYPLSSCEMAFVKSWCPQPRGGIESISSILNIKMHVLPWLQESLFNLSLDDFISSDDSVHHVREMELQEAVDTAVCRIREDLILAKRVLNLPSLAHLTQRRGTERLSGEIVTRIVFPLLDAAGFVVEPEEVFLNGDKNSRCAQADYVIRNALGLVIAVVETKRCHSCPKAWTGELQGAIDQCLKKYLLPHWQRYFLARPAMAAMNCIGGLISDGLHWIYCEVSNGQFSITPVLTLDEESIPSLVQLLLSHWLPNRVAQKS